MNVLIANNVFFSTKTLMHQSTIVMGSCFLLDLPSLFMIKKIIVMGYMHSSIIICKENILTSFSGERRLEVGEWFLPIGVLSASNDYGANPGGNEESGNALLKEMEDAFGFAEGL